MLAGGHSCGRTFSIKCHSLLRGFSLLAKSHQKIKLKIKTENEVIYFGFQSLIFKRNCKVFIFDFSKLPNIRKMLNFLTLLSFGLAIFGQIFLWLMATLATLILTREKMGPKYVTPWFYEFVGAWPMTSLVRSALIFTL
jgi:hypothetical protein